MRQNIRRSLYTWVSERERTDTLVAIFRFRVRPEKSEKTLEHSSHLDDCSSPSIGVSDELQVFQNAAAATLMTTAGKLDAAVTPVLCGFHCLPCMKFKLVMIIISLLSYLL